MLQGVEEELTAEYPARPNPLAATRDASLWVLSGPSAGQYLKLSPAGAVLGRDPSADLVIPDPVVSRRHARLEKKADQSFEIRDLGSRYGVYVEDQKVEVHRLQDGDRIQLSGKTVVRVRFQDSAESRVLEQFQKAMTLDPLTGLANRRSFMDSIRQEVAFSGRHGVPTTLLMMDIDNFKSINDTYGHLAGDAVLKQLSRVIKDKVRAEDRTARYAGDEFMILTRGYGAQDGKRLAERLRATVRKRPVLFGRQMIPLSISIGIATHNPGEPENVLKWIARADSALYAAKNQGRDASVVWSTACEQLALLR